MKIVTVNELSEILKVRPKTLYQWAEMGQIPCIKLNGCLRFDPEDITAWVNSCKKEAGLGYNPLTNIVAGSPKKGGGDSHGALPKG